MIAFRAPTADETVEIRFFQYRTHSECAAQTYTMRWDGTMDPHGARPRECVGCREDMDEGDEDDINENREIARVLAPWRYRLGRTLCLYPARRLPTIPGHDDGDAEPRLERVYPDSI